MARNKRTSIIDCGNEDDAYLAYIAMFRYAFGRMTYMPDVVIEIIKRNVDRLTKRTLYQLDAELCTEAERYERFWKGKTTSNYGMDCDRETWLAFHEWVKCQIRKSESKA